MDDWSLQRDPHNFYLSDSHSRKPKMSTMASMASLPPYAPQSSLLPLHHIKRPDSLASSLAQTTEDNSACDSSTQFSSPNGRTSFHSSPPDVKDAIWNYVNSFFLILFTIITWNLKLTMSRSLLLVVLALHRELSQLGVSKYKHRFSSLNNPLLTSFRHYYCIINRYHGARNTIIYKTSFCSASAVR